MQQREPAGLQLGKRRDRAEGRAQKPNEPEAGAQLRMEGVHEPRRGGKDIVQERRPGLEAGAEDHQIRGEFAAVLKHHTRSIETGDYVGLTAASGGQGSNELIRLGSKLLIQRSSGGFQQLHAQLPGTEIDTNLGNVRRPEQGKKFPKKAEGELESFIHEQERKKHPFVELAFLVVRGISGLEDPVRGAIEQPRGLQILGPAEHLAGKDGYASSQRQDSL